ncbi:MAG: AMP-binding protein [Candidatus Promineifilaceae bacterium]
MAETFPQLLLDRAKQFGDSHVAMREKYHGIWQSYTWADVERHVRHFSLGLVSLGLQPSDTVAIIGDNRPEWIWSELAAQAAGSKSIGLYQDGVVKEMIYILNHAKVKFVVVEDQEQVDKMLELWDELEGIEKVIYYDPKGLRDYTEDFLIDFTDVEELGAQFEKTNPTLFADSVAKGTGEDIAILSTTSGTTGYPKLAMIRQRNLVSMGKALMEIDPLEPTDRFVSFLPLAWIGEQMTSFACSLQNGFTLHFPEAPETAQANIREIGPHSMFSPPRIWENMVSQVMVKIEDSTSLKRRLYHWGMGVGSKMADVRFRKETPSPLLAAQYGLANWLVFQAIKDHLGLRHLKRAYTGGAALGPDVFRFFHALGVNLKQVYGQTEAAGLSVIHRDGDVKFQSVGTPMPGTEVKIAESGEILLRSEAIFAGYYGNEKATNEAIVDGWLQSGDAGYFDDDGHLIVIDRAKDVMTLHDGTKFSPQFIENKLKFSPYIREAVVFGGDWPFVTAMINIDMANAGRWAENNQIAYTTYTDLAQKDRIYKLVREQVERANVDLPEAARIQRFLLLHKELDADDAELTRTRKVRRGFVAQRYDDIISALYSRNDHLDIETTITYQDGRSATLKTRLKIETVGEG